LMIQVQALFNDLQAIHIEKTCFDQHQKQG